MLFFLGRAFLSLTNPHPCVQAAGMAMASGDEDAAASLRPAACHRGPQGAETWTAAALSAVPIGVQPPQIGVWLCSAAYGVPGFHVPQVTTSKWRAIKCPAPGHEPHYPDRNQVSWLPTPCFPLKGMASSCWLDSPCFPFVMLALALPSLGSCLRFSEGWCNKVSHAWVPSYNRSYSPISAKWEIVHLGVCRAVPLSQKPGWHDLSCLCASLCLFSLCLSLSVSPFQDRISPGHSLKLALSWQWFLPPPPQCWDSTCEPAHSENHSVPFP